MTFEISSNPYLTNDLALRPCFNIFTQPEVLLDAKIIADTHIVDISNPLFADKFAVGYEGVYAVRTEQTYKLINQLSVFFPIGVFALIKQRKQQRNGNALIGHSRHKYIDVDLRTSSWCGLSKAPTRS